MQCASPAEVQPPSWRIAFFSTHGLVFASACEIVPARTAEALAMVRSFMANAPISAMGSVPCSTAARIMTMASAVLPSTALSATQTGDLRIGGQILVDTVEPHRIIVKVETQLLAHGGEFAGFAAEHGYQLLRGHRFDSTTAFLEFSEYEIELGIRFLQIRHVLFASAGFHQLVDDLAPFDAALVLADHHAGAVRILGGLLGVRHQSFGELFVGILQVDEFDHGNVGKQRWADGFIEGILVGRCGVELDEFDVGSRFNACAHSALVRASFKYESPPGTTVTGTFAAVFAMPPSRHTGWTMTCRHNGPAALRD